VAEATVRASIKALVEGVADVGNVYDLAPFASTWDVFIDRFKVTLNSVDMIRGFSISCVSILPEGFVATGLRQTGNKAIYTYKIRGYQGFDFETSTEKTFLIVVLAVMAALDGGIVTGDVQTANLAQLDPYQPRLFGGVLCHYAEITQVVTETIT